LERLSEAREELTKLLTLRELATIPFVVLGNKIDLDGALSEDEFRQAVNLWQTTGKGNVFLRDGIRPIEVFMWYVSRLRLANQ
jgi:GTP-binding protein SAR1